MIAVNFMRYWWLRPQIQDPSLVDDHDPLKSREIVTHLEPESGPQFEEQGGWTQIPHYYGERDPLQRSIIEIEKALSERKEMILVEPFIAGQMYYHYVSTGWLLQENIIFYGGIGLCVSHFFPRAWLMYVPCTLLALLHSWLYFRVYKYDRLSEYQAYSDDRHPVSNLVTAWVLGQRPDHFQFILRRQKNTKWEFLSELCMYTGVASTLRSLGIIEESIVGGRWGDAIKAPTPLTEALNQPAALSGYYHPPEVIYKAYDFYLPADIPFTFGWFDMKWLNFRPRPIRQDLAIMLTVLGCYFAYKMYEHFFGFRGDQHDPDGQPEVDELGRSWLKSEDAKKMAMRRLKEGDSYWMEDMGDDEALVLGDLKERGTKELIEERNEITRIANKKPFGWMPPGYDKHSFGVFT